MSSFDHGAEDQVWDGGEDEGGEEGHLGAEGGGDEVEEEMFWVGKYLLCGRPVAASEI